MHTDTELSLIHSKIFEANARYQGTDMSSFFEAAGKNISRELSSRYGRNVSYAFLCGKGNKGGIGLSTALALLKKNTQATISVFLVGRTNEIRPATGKMMWERLEEINKSRKFPNLLLHQDCYATDIGSRDVIVECLVGSGIRGQLKKRYRDVIKRTSHFKKPMVTIDLPAPGYSWDLSLSLLYPKTADAKVLDINLPGELETIVGPGEVKALSKPNKSSHKTQNTKVLIISGDNNPLASKAAGFYAGKVDTFSISQASNATVNARELESAVDSADSILIGDNLPDNLITKSLIAYLFTYYPEKRYVIYGNCVSLVAGNIDILPQRMIIIASRQQLHNLLTGNNGQVEGKIRSFSLEHNAYILLLGSQWLVYGKNPFTERNDPQIVRPHPSLAGCTELDTVSVGIISALTGKNDPWLSLTAGAFLTSLAVDISHREGNCSPDTVITNIQEAFTACCEY